MAAMLEKGGRVRVAVVGTGMAGLVTAWLLQNDPTSRYQVKVFESGKETSLDSASVSVLDPNTNMIDRVDVPMRAFTEGYYHNLKAMYDYLGVRYQVQPFLFSFARRRESHEEQYFIHASNNHQLPPRKPREVQWISYLGELVFVIVCYVWFGAACLMVSATSNADGLGESFEEYLRRICLPWYFVQYYLLPLMSAVTTCTHQALLCFPAKDIVDYKRCITSGRQLVVSEGVGKVQSKLLKGLDVCHSAQVRAVEPSTGGIKVSWSDSSTQEAKFEDTFDRVILAVPPNVVGAIFAPLRKEMALLPTTPVQTVVHHDLTAVPELTHLRDQKPLLTFGKHHSSTQVIHLRTSGGLDIRTEATHVQLSGVMVTSCPLQPLSPAATIHNAAFTRVLRTPESRRVVNHIFSLGGAVSRDSKASKWKNGDQGVFLVGSWCWDGMVLLEGCIVSAMRTAQALGIRAPWNEQVRSTNTSPYLTKS